MASPDVAEDGKAGEEDREDQPEVPVGWKTCCHGDPGLEEGTSRGRVSCRDSRRGSLGDFASRTIHQADAPLAPKSILKNQPAQNGPDHVPAIIPGTIFSIVVKAVRRELMYSTAPHGARALGNERTLTYNSCER